jgi:hypothetical protein
MDSDHFYDLNDYLLYDAASRYDIRFLQVGKVYDAAGI